MTFSAHRLRAVFEGQGEHGFMVWTYATNDPIEEVLASGYFAGPRNLLRVGDLIYLGVSQREPLSPWIDRAPETRRALLMVQAHDGGPVRVRLVQDYGRPEDPSAPLMVPPRPRGRPRKEDARDHDAEEA